ncbi:hypothetical protein B0H14DRAFT_2621042 [Mycena olivaceomarginata]|nr:hypothetical protein B0H14DRAFT_2621042 [Mycena olivaceomarginata]
MPRDVSSAILPEALAEEAGRDRSHWLDDIRSHVRRRKHSTNGTDTKPTRNFGQEHLSRASRSRRTHRFRPTPTINLNLDTVAEASTNSPPGIPACAKYIVVKFVDSPEPYMRERLRDPSIISYLTAMNMGQTESVLSCMQAYGLWVGSRPSFQQDGVKAGDYMYGFTTWEPIQSSPTSTRVPDLDGTFPWTKYVGCLGTPGLTAFIGLECVAESKPGQTTYVSSGVSGVGRLTVIASAGTDAKANYLFSLDADVAFNYKTIPVAAALQEHRPIDLFWDNVRGAQLEAALGNMNMKGRVICCGAIAEYNIPADERYGVKNMSTVFHRRIRLEGFVVADT